jgi:type II secretory ATPase GspE/PulE/Tfp pilus assembly ATPase PilB-like protein
VAELLDPSATDVSRAILECRDATQLQVAAVNAGMIDLSQRVADAIQSGWTSEAEVIRVLGLPRGPFQPGDGS